MKAHFAFLLAGLIVSLSLLSPAAQASYRIEEVKHTQASSSTQTEGNNRTAPLTGKPAADRQHDRPDSDHPDLFAFISVSAALLGLTALAFSAAYSIPFLLLVASGAGLVATVFGALGLRSKRYSRLAIAGMVVGMVMCSLSFFGYLLDKSGYDLSGF
jgi:hypothetical protein